jgi:hypothetical protein
MKLLWHRVDTAATFLPISLALLRQSIDLHLQVYEFLIQHKVKQDQQLFYNNVQDAKLLVFCVFVREAIWMEV